MLVQGTYTFSTKRYISQTEGDMDNLKHRKKRRLRKIQRRDKREEKRQREKKKSRDRE